MIRYLLDTNVLSEPARQQPNQALDNRLSERRAACATASTVWHELCCGCLRLPPSRRRAELERYLSELSRSQLPILPYDSVAARLHAELRGPLEARGIVCSHADGEIASIAILHGLILVTRNQRHFSVIPGLPLKDWFA